MSEKFKMLSATVVAATIMAASCAGAEDEKTRKLTVEGVPSVAADLSDASTPPSKPPSPIGAGMQRLVDMAIKDLAARFGIDKANVEVVEAEYVTWRDSSIGCPRPGMQYMQVLTNGSRIVLKANNMAYHYHSGGSRPPMHCAKPAPQEPLPYAPGEA